MSFSDRFLEAYEGAKEKSAEHRTKIAAVLAFVAGVVIGALI